jgi:hypothetical protein
MSVDNSSTQEDKVVAAVEDNDDDFTAGFNGGTETTITPVKEDPKPEPVAEAVKTPEPEAPKFAQITEADWQRVLNNSTDIEKIKAENKSRFDNAFGQLGAFKQRMEQMTAATPAGEKITDDEIKAFAEEYPNLAGDPVFKKLFKNLKGTAAPASEAAPAPTGPTYDPAAIELMMGQRISAVEEKIVDASLNAVFPGWKQEVKAEKFGKWLNEQPEDIKKLAASNDVGDAARMLTLFRSAKSAPAAAPGKTTRQKQIEAAVNPKGAGGKPSGPTEEDDFVAGFNSA